MLLAYEIDVRRRLVIVSANGFALVDEWFATIEAACADPRCGAGFDVLYDRTRVAELPDARRVRAWAARHAKQVDELGLGRLAVVVTSPAVFGMVRMASVYAESAGAVVSVFWSETEALRWLGRDSGGSTA